MAFRSWRRALLLLGALFSVASLQAGNAIEQDLRSFGTTGTVLHIGAHPDDENTQLITYLSLGRGYRVAYLSLTRGDGGQNELGRDFDEKLGVARTQELLAARRFDHGRQFFTRAIDFGFSKTPEETLRFWDRDAVLGDVVRIIRQYRPDVIVTRFPIPPGSGGHGHHTASAILAVEAFKLAGDPKAYPEQLAQGLTVWQPKRVVWNSFSFGGAGPNGLNGPTVKMDIAGTDPVSGETFGTIANESRGMHKTQGLGGFSGRAATGPNMQNFMLLAGEPWPGDPARTNTGLAAASNGGPDLMDGVDTTWARYPGGAEIGALAAAALAQFKADDPAASVPALLALRTKLATLPTDPLTIDKRAQLDRILQACLGLKVETTLANAEVVPGEPLKLTLAFSMAARTADVRYVETRNPALKLAAGPGGELTGVLPLTTPLTQPYWLRADGAAGISRVDDPSLIGRPENPPAIPLEHVFTVGDQTLVIADEPVQPVQAPTGAQSRLSVKVIPPVSLALNSEIFLVPPGTTKPVTVEVTAARANSRGTLRLELPAGWSAAPGPQDFRLPNVGDKASFTFTVTSPSAGSAGRLTAVAKVDGHDFSNQRYEVRYDHIPVQLLQPPARARLASFDLATRGLTIGYLPGAGDYVAECLEQMGYVVHRLTGADLTPEKLHGFDAVVIGVRAFNERTDLKDAFPGLLAWVEAGGTVIAQYNRPNGLKAEQLGPYPLSIEGPAPALRVTDETAPVTLLAPDHAAVNTPNKINPADFDGWVQERGAYFPSKWDEEHYVALLGMSDPGEAQLKSSILVAKYGSGHYVYTGIGFFRQLPAGVPGAYRLFANLLSLGK
ncbi:PIG-L family deacetylase [Opitutus sp. GAS368]|uniref:PIG-L family deacetylase n=1 Tax=Opitutus sp. GAS368 TaxID=1882749 RepID=UPI00087B0924|nr:PIG-L family deacetylase [Opitutus sp. GAS368]SDS10109.1 N-acetylglucosaminyl deacetylase, LmbE family [Opitutus sp. GAS368]